MEQQSIADMNKANLPEVIISKDNQHLKIVRSLQSSKGRRQHGLFLAEGLRLSEEALHYAECSFVLLAEDLLEQPRLQPLIQLCRKQQVQLLPVQAGLLTRAAATEHSQGVLAAVKLPLQQKPAQSGWYAYADELADPGNLGTIWRTAHAAGAAALLLSKNCTDAFNPKTVRASMGAAFKLPVFRCNSNEEARSLFCELGATPLVARADGQDVRCLQQQLSEPHVWILGAEATGVSAFWQQEPALAVSLPMQKEAESLNVASAAAVLFYQSCFARLPLSNL